MPHTTCHIRQTLTHENDVLATKRKTLESKILQLHATILSDVSSLVAVVVVVIVACDEVVLLGRHAVELQLRIAVVRRDGREVAVSFLDEVASNLFLAVCSESKQCRTEISIGPRK